jgi:hypoxanthine phosphoribosyltransferase
MMDLVREMDIPVAFDFIAVASYGESTESSGVVRMLKDLDADLAGRNVLIVEDIIDSGLTLAYLRGQLLRRGPASLRICTLLNKPERRTADVPVDYLGFDIPNEFVVGYGLDYAERYRNLPYIGVIKPRITHHWASTSRTVAMSTCRLKGFHSIALCSSSATEGEPISPVIKITR